MAKYICLFTIQRLVFDSWRHFVTKRNVQFSRYCIMPSHLHYIVTTLNKEYTIVSMQRDFKRYMVKRILEGLEYERKNGSFDKLSIFNDQNTAKSPENIIRLFEKTGRYSNQKHKIWMPDDKPIIVLSEKFFRQKLLYIHNNPVTDKIVENILDYPCSSASQYHHDSNQSELYSFGQEKFSSVEINPPKV